MSGADRLRRHAPLTVLRLPGGELWSGGAEEAAEAIRHEPDAAVVLYDVFTTRPSGSVMALCGLLDAPREVRRLEFDLLSGGRSVPRRSHRFSDRYLAPQPPLERGGWAPLMELEVAEAAELEVRVGGESVRLAVPANPFADLARVDLAQQTLQRDYDARWVRDHSLFHHRAHRYGRILFYDNMSSDAGRIADELRGLDEGLEVAWVDWPVPLERRRWSSAAKRYVRYWGGSQRAAYTHGFHLFGHSARFISHFDLDEYLHNGSGRDLVEYLESRTAGLPFRYIKERRFTERAEAPPGSLPRAWHFRQRALMRDNFDKPICATGGRSILYVNTHTVHTSLAPPALPRRVRFRQALNPRSLWLAWRWRGQALGAGWRKHAWERALARHGNVQPWLPGEELAYFHLKGINNGWRRPPRARPLLSLGGRVARALWPRRARDGRLAALMRELGLTDDR